LRLPADTVVFICEHAADALRLVPDAVVLPGRKYQELVDEMARLREQLHPKRAVPPSRCQIKGRIEGRFASLQVQFDFVTERPDTVVGLACTQGQASSATLDGHVPAFRADTDGFSVQVAKPGEHQLTLELLVPLNDRGPTPAATRTAETTSARTPSRGWQGVELALPRAAVTTLELELPAGARDARLAGVPVAETLVVLKNNRLAGSLGPTDKLDLTWRVPAAGAAALLVAEGRVRVRLDQTGLTSSAELTLRAEAGQADVWRLVAPRDTTIRLPPADENRLKEPVKVVPASNSSLSEYTLQLKEPTSEPLTVVLTTRRPMPRPGSTVTVGPFAVPRAARQLGLLQISNAVPDLHLDYRTHGDLVYKQVAIEEERRSEPNLVAVFRYGSISATGTAVGPGIDLGVETVLSQVKTRVSHALSLRSDPPTGNLRWYISTTLVATPRWADVDQLRVIVPPDWEPLDDTSVAADRVVTLKLPRSALDASPRPVTLTLDGRYPPGIDSRAEAATRTTHPWASSVSLALPRPLGVVNQGGELTVQVPREFEVSLTGDPLAGLEAAGRQTPHEQSWRGRSLPESLSVQWRPYAPDVRAHVLVDLDLTPRGGEVRRQEVRLQLPQPSPTQLLLRVPLGVADLRVLSGGTLQVPDFATRVEDAAKMATVLLRPAPSAGRTSEENELVLVLAYSFRLPPATEGGKFLVPLVTLTPAAQGDARVRVWCESGILPVPAGAAWDRLPIEEVADRKALPALVLGAPRAEAPLALRWGEAPAAFAVLVDRALVRVELSEGGGQHVSARYRLRQLSANHLDVELPMPVALVDLKVLLGGKTVAFDPVDEGGRSSAAGRSARLRVGPDLVRVGSVLEVSFTLPPAASGAGGIGLLTTVLTPPVLREDPGAVPTCWHVTVPPSWIVLGPESGPGAERTWGRRGWLLTPRLSRGTAQAGWEGLGEAPELVEGDGPAVVCWRTGTEPLTLTHVSQLAWLLACSPVLLVVGLGLHGLGGANSARGLALGLALLATLIGIGAVLRPTVLSALAYGCEPGLCVLAVVLVVQWLLHERYRRQVVFLPSFSRKGPGSSLVRGVAAAAKPPGEPSTVDVPRPAPSSAT
jgi:hypothetical protein